MGNFFSNTKKDHDDDSGGDMKNNRDSEEV